MARDIKIGECYQMYSGIIRRVIEFEEVTPNYTRVRLENINGKRPGFCHWESLEWFANNVVDAHPSEGG